MAKDIDKTKIRVYDVSIDGVDVGYCDEPEVTIEKILSELKLSQLHGQVMGHRLLGVSATVKVSLREVNQANLAKAFPWYTSGNIDLMPTSLGQDLYQYAKPVVLHPVDMAADTSEDVSLLKAVCTGPLTLKGDGESDAVIPLELFAYPDRAQLPDLVLGTIGTGA